MLRVPGRMLAFPGSLRIRVGERMKRLVSNTRTAWATRERSGVRSRVDSKFPVVPCVRVDENHRQPQPG